ncbi:hypothetical protein ACFLW4_03895 [Chloroflexota bacterium]
MKKLSRETADREMNRALEAYEHANDLYYQILRRYISSKSAIPGEKLRRPDAELDATGLKEIDTAWLKVQETGKQLRKAYMTVYEAHL